MTLIKTSILTAASTLIKMMCGFVIAKIIAIFLGPAGLALMGQFQNFIQITQNFSGGMLGHGIVKYIAEYKNDAAQKKEILSSALFISLISSILVGFILFIYRDYFAI